MTDPAHSPLFVALGALCVAAMSSTQDIMVDGLRIEESLPESEQGNGIACRMSPPTASACSISTAGVLLAW